MYFNHHSSHIQYILASSSMCWSVPGIRATCMHGDSSDCFVENNSALTSWHSQGGFLACCLGMTNTGLCSTCVSCQYTNACSFYIDIKMGKTQITAVDHNILLRFWPSSDAFSRPQGDTKGEIKACFARQAKWGEQHLPPSNGRNSRGQIINRCLWSDRNHALCWSSRDADSSTRSVAERAGGRMLPLPLRTPQGDVLAPRYPKPCGTNPAWKTLAAQTSQRLRPSATRHNARTWGRKRICVSAGANVALSLEKAISFKADYFHITPKWSTRLQNDVKNASMTKSEGLLFLCASLSIWKHELSWSSYENS